MKYWTIAILPGALFAISLVISLSKNQSLIIFTYILWFITFLLLMGVVYWFVKHFTAQVNVVDINKANCKPFPVPVYEFAVMEEAVNNLAKYVKTYETERWQKTAQQAGDSLQLVFSSTVDGLTGVANRKFFDTRLKEMFAKEKSLSVMLLDIDFFKKVNDTYGHQAGDEVLQQFAQIVFKTVREGDFVARYGGEEFAVLTPVNLKEAIPIAERIRKTVETTPIQSCEGTINITVSVGVTGKSNNDTTQTLIQRVDKNLYKAKDNGRNKVEARSD